MCNTGDWNRIFYTWMHHCLALPILGDPGAVSRAQRKGATKVFKHRWKSPWVPTLTEPFPNGQANAGSRLRTKNVLYYCAQSANSISWVLFVSSYTTPIDWITVCLAHAPKKCTQSGIFQFDIQLFRESLSEKVHATIPKSIVGGFEFAFLQRNLKEWHERPWTYVCAR